MLLLHEECNDQPPITPNTNRALFRCASWPFSTVFFVVTTQPSLPSPLKRFSPPKKPKKMAPGYEIGPLGVPVIKDNYSTTGRGQRSPAKMRAVAPAAAISRGLAATSAIDLPSRPAGESAPQANSDLFGSGHDGTSSSLLPTSEGGAGVGDVEGVGAPSRRGSGLRELLGIETHAERDREKSRVQAEALKKQVEDNKVG